MEKEVVNVQDEFLKEDYKKDQFEIQISSKNIKFNFHQLYKYSEKIQSEYYPSNIDSNLTTEIQQIQQKMNIKKENIIIFSQLLNEESVEISINEYFDLFKLSKYFQVNTLLKLLSKYAKNHLKNIDFIIKLIKENDSNIFEDEINPDELEKCLINQINESLNNQNFEELPISMIYRIIKQSRKSEINQNLLFDFINKKKEERYVLFTFLDLQKLEDSKFDELYNNYHNEKDQSFYYEYLSNNLYYIKQLRETQKNLENQIKNLLNKEKELNLKMNQIINENQQLKKNNDDLQNKIDETSKENNLLKEESTKLKENFNDLKIQFEQSSVENHQLKSKIEINKKHNDDLQKKIDETSKENKLLKEESEQLKENFMNIKIQFEQTSVENQQYKNEIQNHTLNNNKLKKQIDKLENENKQNKEANKNQPKIIKDIPYKTEFEGIINYFRKRSNINDEINITCSTHGGGEFQILYQYERTGDVFFTGCFENSWICFEIKKHEIIPTHYTIRTYNGLYHPRSWIIEGSLNSNEWKKLDEQNDCSFLAGSNLVHTFSIKIKKKVKFIRIRQTAKNWGDGIHLAINCIEFFGEIV